MEKQKKGTNPTNNINTPYTSREGKQPRDKGNHLGGNKWDIENLQIKRSLQPTLETLMKTFHSMNMRSGPVTLIKLVGKGPY